MTGLPVQPGPNDAGPAFGPDNTPYDAIGGEGEVRALVVSFYRHMDDDARFATIRGLHDDDLTSSTEKLFEFLCGWLGGPQLYIQKHGHPRLRMRHAPFPIGDDERDQWLACMNAAMDERGIDGELRAFLEQRFTHTANFMRNKA